MNDKKIEENSIEISIDGVLTTDKYTDDEVTEMFIDWVESKGMSFGGGIEKLD